MAIDLKKTKMTTQTWVLLAVLVLSGVGYSFLDTSEPAAAVAKPVPVGVQGAKTLVPDKQAVTIPAETLEESLAVPRDPFQVPAAYQKSDKVSLNQKINDVNKTIVTNEPKNTTNYTTNENSNNTIKTVTRVLPELNGTVVGGDSSMAIMTLGTNRKTVKLGESIGEYILVQVHGDSVVLSGPDGIITLWIKR